MLRVLEEIFSVLGAHRLSYIPACWKSAQYLRQIYVMLLHSSNYLSQSNWEMWF